MNTPIPRRKFLVGAGAAVGAAAGGLIVGRTTLGSASGPGPVEPAVTLGRSGPLIIVTLYGGNDGLNTVVPYADPAYAKLRPNLGYQAKDVLDIGDGLGLNPKLTGLHQLWGQGHLAVVRGVGYPNPNLSHFQSMDIWQTANVVDGTGTGWLGRWLDTTGTDPLRAVSLGATVPPCCAAPSGRPPPSQPRRSTCPAGPGSCPPTRPSRPPAPTVPAWPLRSPPPGRICSRPGPSSIPSPGRPRRRTWAPPAQAAGGDPERWPISSASWPTCSRPGRRRPSTRSACRRSTPMPARRPTTRPSWPSSTAPSPVSCPGSPAPPPVGGWWS